MSFQDACGEADKRYKLGKPPIAIEAETWERAHEVRRKLARGSIPSTWWKPEWTLDRLYRHLQHVAEQARLRSLPRATSKAAPAGAVSSNSTGRSRGTKRK